MKICYKLIYCSSEAKNFPLNFNFDKFNYELNSKNYETLNIEKDKNL